MTKREMFELIATLCADNADVVKFCNHEIELLANRKSYKRTGPTKNQVANAGLIDQMKVFIGEQGTVTCADLETQFGLSNQKVSALMRLADGVEKIPAHGKVKVSYRLAD